MIYLKRTYLKNSTIGVFQDKDYENICYSFELQTLNNARNQSCINEGIYEISIEFHQKFHDCIRLHNVHERDGILIHTANLVGQLRGCIAAADTLNRFMNGGANSRIALNRLIEEVKKLPPKDRKLFVTQ